MSARDGDPRAELLAELTRSLRLAGPPMPAAVRRRATRPRAGDPVAVRADVGALVSVEVEGAGEAVSRMFIREAEPGDRAGQVVLELELGPGTVMELCRQLIDSLAPLDSGGSVR